MMLLPAKPGTCEECATAHPKEAPHNQQSFYWGVRFNMQNGRSPTWADAMAHCDEKTKSLWIDALAERGIKVEATGGKT